LAVRGLDDKLTIFLLFKKNLLFKIGFKLKKEPKIIDKLSKAITKILEINTKTIK
jgi:hypothetical protein